MSGVRVLVTTALCVAFAAGCSGKGKEGPKGATSAGPGGTLRVFMAGDFEHLDPARNYVTGSQDFARLIYRTLTTYAAKPGVEGAEIVPDLATDLGTPSDGARTWTFTLREGLRYEDGRPVTTKDIKYGVQRTFASELPEGPPYARMWLRGAEKYKGPYVDRDGVAAIETPDERTIRFHLNRPVADFGAAASMPYFAPVPQDKDTGVAYDTRPFSSGPYKIERYDRGKSIVLVRNQFWDARTDPVRRALPDRIEVDQALDAAVIDQRMIASQGDDASAVQFGDLQASSVGRVAADPNLKPRLVSGLAACTRYLSLNATRKPLDDVRVRQAIQYAVDKEALRTARGGPMFGELATGILPPTVPGHQKFDPYPTPDGKGDPVKAKDLLAGAGHAGGFDTTIDAPANATGKAQAEAIQAALAKAGIRTTINSINVSAYYSTIGTTGKQGGISLDGWCPDWPGASTFLPPILDGRFITPQGNQNRARYNSVEVNAKFDMIAAMSDGNAANQAYGEADRLIMRDAPIVPFLWEKRSFLVGTNVVGAYGHVAFSGQVDLVSPGLKPA